MKRLLTLFISLFLTISLFAQTQYDYYDDSAVAGGVERAIRGLIFIAIIIVIAIVLVFLLGAILKIYYWFNPQADPDNKRAKTIEENKKKQKEDLIQKTREQGASQIKETKASTEIHKQKYNTTAVQRKISENF